jgi:hypothetical protein
MRLMIIEGEEHMPGIAPWPFTVIFFFCDLWDLEAPFFNLLFYRCLVSLIIQNVARHAWQHRLAERDENGTGNGARAVTRAGSVDVFNVSHGHRTDTSHCRSNRACRRPAGTRRERLQLPRAGLCYQQSAATGATGGEYPPPHAWSLRKRHARQPYLVAWLAIATTTPAKREQVN